MIARRYLLAAAAAAGSLLALGAHAASADLEKAASATLARLTSSEPAAVAPLAGKLTTTSLRDGVYVFFVDQKGLFAGAGIEGTKISRVSD